MLAVSVPDKCHNYLYKCNVKSGQIHARSIKPYRNKTTEGIFIHIHIYREIEYNKRFHISMHIHNAICIYVHFMNITDQIINSVIQLLGVTP